MHQNNDLKRVARIRFGATCFKRRVDFLKLLENRFFRYLS